MAKVLSIALKEDQCKGLLRLVAGLTDGAGRTKSTQILRLADVRRTLLQTGALSVAGFDWRGTGTAIADIVFEKSNNKNEFS
jgi:hypothetical protein